MISECITVIIPVYNGERYLADGIESVLAQTHPPAEVLVVDDGSTDNSAVIAQEYAPQVRFWHQSNLGPAAARNAGIRMSTGELLAFLDADDLWAPDKLARQVEILEQRSDLEAVLGHIEEFVSPDISDEMARRLRAMKTAHPGYSAGTLLVRRSVFLSIGYLDEDLQFGEFIDWWARAMDAGLTYAMLPGVVMRRRLHGDNHTLRHRTHTRDYLRVARAALERRRRG